jgi:hypothetical protein
MSSVFAEAQRLVAAGVSVISIAADGTKRPVVSWKDFQNRRPTAGELQRGFASAPCGLAIVGGDGSGGLEVLDFDATEIFDPWRAIVEELAPGLLERLPLTQTPSAGRHVPYRCAIVEGNQKLARGLNAEGRPETLIETKPVAQAAMRSFRPHLRRVTPSISRTCCFEVILPQSPLSRLKSAQSC